MRDFILCAKVFSDSLPDLGFADPWFWPASPFPPLPSHNVIITYGYVSNYVSNNLSSAAKALKDGVNSYIDALAHGIPNRLHILFGKVKHHLQRLHDQFLLAAQDDPGPLRPHLPTLGTVGQLWTTSTRIIHQLLNGRMPSDLTDFSSMWSFVLARQAIQAAGHESGGIQDAFISHELSNTLPADDWHRWRNILSPTDRPLFDKALRLLLGQESEGILDNKSCRSSHDVCGNFIFSDTQMQSLHTSYESESSAEGELFVNNILPCAHNPPTFASDYDVSRSISYPMAHSPTFHDLPTINPDLEYDIFQSDSYPKETFTTWGRQSTVSPDLDDSMPFVDETESCRLRNTWFPSAITPPESVGTTGNVSSNDAISVQAAGLVSTAVFGVILIVLVYIDNPGVVSRAVVAYWTEWFSSGGCHTPSAFITVLLCLAIDVSPRPSPCMVNNEGSHPSDGYVHNHENTIFTPFLHDPSTDGFSAFNVVDPSVAEANTSLAPLPATPYIVSVQNTFAHDGLHETDTDVLGLHEIIHPYTMASGSDITQAHTSTSSIQPCPRCNSSDFSEPFNRNKHVKYGTLTCPAGNGDAIRYCRNMSQGCKFKNAQPYPIKRHELRCKVGKGGKPRQQRKALARVSRG